MYRIVGTFGGNNVWQMIVNQKILCEALLCFMLNDKTINLCALSYFYPVGVSNDELSEQQYLARF